MAMQNQLGTIKKYVVLTDETNMPTTCLKGAISYEAFIDGYSTEFNWPDLDENTASSLCYTSGTTGNPKGILYSHRSIILHAFAIALPDAMSLSANDVIMPIVPMFHVNAWSIPYAAVITGAKLVMPGSKMGNGEALCHLINEEQVTISAGTPTVWLALLDHLKSNDKTIEPLQRIVVGGAACPLSIIQEFEQKLGVYVHHAWGMTETSPLGTFNSHSPEMKTMNPAQQDDLKLKQGRSVYGVDLKIVDAQGTELPWDGQAFGELKVRGPWVCKQYFKLDSSNSHDEDGWFATGDVVHIDKHGYMQITDRVKDVIKSGGEWISSIDLENAAVCHPDIAEAAVIGRDHPKWNERPLLIVVANTIWNSDDLMAWMGKRVAKWWLPEDIVELDAIPHTATGKIDKKALRTLFSDYQFPSVK